MHEYGKRPISRPLPRYDGEKHYDEAKTVSQLAIVARITTVLCLHARDKEWYDEQLGVTQYLCTCRMWFYDHIGHQAQEIAEALGLIE